MSDFPIQYHHSGNMELCDPRQAAGSPWVHGKPFGNLDKHIHHAFYHSSEGNRIVSIQAGKIDRVDHMEGD